MIVDSASEKVYGNLPDWVAGRVAEWLKAVVSKTTEGLALREFESRPFRHTQGDTNLRPVPFFVTSGRNH